MHKNLANQSLARVRHTFKVRELDHLAGLQLGSPTRSVYAWHPRIVQLRVAAALHATKPTSTLADDYESAAANHRERGVGTSRRSGRQSNVRVGRQLSGGEAVELAVAGRPVGVFDAKRKRTVAYCSQLRTFIPRRTFPAEDAAADRRRRRDRTVIAARACAVPRCPHL